MKRIVGLLLALLLVFGLFACTSGSATPEPTAQPEPTAAPTPEPTLDPNRPIVFSDPVLEEMIRAQMGKPDGDISVSDALTVTSLELTMDGTDWSNPRIKDLDALKYFTNLTYLGMSWALYNDGKEVDLSPLSGLVKLECLLLGCDSIRDISPLSSLVNLKSLWIWGNHSITDISAVASMTQLSDLWIKGNYIQDLSPLANLKELTRLCMEDNLVSDISPLAGLPKLTELTLSDNPITDYSPIASIYPTLQNPDFDLDPNNDVIAMKDAVLESAIRETIQKPNGDITFADVWGVESLNADRDWEEKPAEGSQIKDISALKYFLGMKDLGLQFQNIQNIRPLAGLIKLESLRLGGNPVNDVDALSKLTNLSKLSLWNCVATDYSSLTRLTKLQSLAIGYSTFSNLTLLVGMPELISLDIVKSQVKDVYPLLQLPKLEKLFVRECPIADYAPLIQIYPNLKETDFDPNDDSIAAQTKFPDDEVIVFNDPLLESKVREAMNRPDGDITFADAKTVTGLKLNNDYQQNPAAGSQITNIDALKYFVNLDTLELQFHAVKDISPLAGLTKLRALALGGNPVQDISAISGMTGLDYLSLFNCEASDYSPLKNLVNLRILQIGYSTFGDASVLQDLTKLDTLELIYAQVTDVSPLASLSNLKSLKLEGNPIQDYSPLKKIYANLQEKDFQP